MINEFTLSCDDGLHGGMLCDFWSSCSHTGCFARADQHNDIGHLPRLTRSPNMERVSFGLRYSLEMICFIYLQATRWSFARRYRAMPEQFYQKTKLEVVNPSNFLDYIKEMDDSPWDFWEWCSGSGRLSLAAERAGLRIYRCET